MGIDWPTAGVVITALVSFAAPITVAAVKLLPNRTFSTDQNGHRLARGHEVVDLRARVATLEQSIEKESTYMHTSIHAIRESLHIIQMKIALIEQSMNGRNKGGGS